MKKILGIIILLNGVLIFANDNVTQNIKKFNEVNKSYNQKLEKLNQLEEVDLEALKIKSKYAVISGRNEAKANIATTFNYYKNSVYEVFTRPMFTTAIKLNSDENLTYIGGGDTENWDLDTTRGGADNSEIIFMKPLFSGQKTNLTIVTNKRTYFIYLQSTNKHYNPFIEWQYPYDTQINFIKNRKNNNDLKMATNNPREIVFGYEYNKNYNISPTQIFNDGVKTILLMPQKLQEMPVVYAYSEDGSLTQINYRVIGNRIIVDKVLNKMQLILGKTILEIKKK